LEPTVLLQRGLLTGTTTRLAHERPRTGSLESADREDGKE
jgi:hypothetical protein